MDQLSRIYVAGHKGLIGSALIRNLKSNGFKNVITRSHSELELTDALAVDQFFEVAKPEYVILAAGKVGGIIVNDTYPADFININLAIQLNVLKSAQRVGVSRLILFASSCMYPKNCSQPMSEDLLFSGYLEPTSLAYAVSKLAGVQMCLAYNRQYGQKRFIPVIPNTVFGTNDNFDLKSSHVLSALIRRFHEAKEQKLDKVVLWGSGTPRREFIYSDDVANACLVLLKNDLTNIEFPLNIGTGKDISIGELAEKIAKVVGYSAKIEWDLSKPDGAPCKLFDSSRLLKFGWKPLVELTEGLSKTYKWYLEVHCNQLKKV
jgi:GDP-L-fucose synthase